MTNEQATHCEDDCWIWGIFYYNPYDSRFLVPNRFGLIGKGKTMNYGKKVGSIINMTGIVISFSGLCLCLWTFFIQYVPIQLIIEENQLIATQLRDEYVIFLEDIQEFKLLEELPFTIIKSDFNNVSKGKYYVAKQGKYTFFYSPDNTFFILVKDSRSTYLLSSYNDESTLEVYDELLNQIYDAKTK